MNHLISIENGLNLELSIRNLTAQIAYSPKAKGMIIVPKSVCYQSQDFIITKIKENSFIDNELIESLNFPENSSLFSIEKNSFKNSSIKSISIPPSCEELEDGWCNQTSKLTNVLISPTNTRFKYADEGHKIIIWKSDKNKDAFDVLIFASRDIEAAQIPSSIKIISPYSFDLCSHLQTVQINENSELRTIGKKAFTLTLIKNIFIPSKVEEIQEGAFYCIPTLNQITISPENKFIKFIDEKNQIIAMKSDKNKENFDILIRAGNRDCKKVIIPSNIKRICRYAFEKLNDLLTVEIPENSELQTIGKKAFYYTEIESIFIPDKVQILEDGWCKATNKLNHVIISPINDYFKYSDENKQIVVGKKDINIHNYDNLIFACRSIKKAIIPSYIKSIKPWAFANCQELETIEIPNNSELKSIGKFAFSYSNIRNFVIPKSVEIIDKFAFYWCMKLGKVKIEKKSKLKSISKGLFYQTYLKSLKIPKKSEIRKIEDEAFYSTSLKSLYIPASVEELSEKWICGMNQLSKVFVSSKNKHFKYVDNDKQIIVSKSDKNSEIFDVLIYGSRSIEKVTIPNQVKCINSDAFNHCHRLQRIEISEESELQSIGPRSFSNCKNLESFFIPKNLVELHESWCESMYELTDIKISPKNHNFKLINDFHKIVLGKSEINSDIFDVLIFASRDIEAVEIPSTIKIIKSCAFERCSKLKSVKFSENSELKIIEKNAFACSMIEEITIPKSVEIIEKDVFNQCEHLAKFEIQKDSKLKALTSFLFGSCKKLKSLEIPDDSKIETIEQYVFYDSAIERFHILESIKILREDWCNFVHYLNHVTISPNNNNFKFIDEEHLIIAEKSDSDKEVFDVICFACRSITKAVIPSYIKYIRASSFSYCKKLTQIEFSENSELKSIGCNAFESTAIKNFCIPKNVDLIEFFAFIDCTFMESFEFLGDYLSDFSDLFHDFFYSSKLKIVSFPNTHKIRVKEDFISYLNNSLFLICANAQINI